jgi:methylenetetrahydrofolate--tRNA-(uracil-5-)-methyltransferase
MTGVEGYVESAASGMLAGINLARYLNGQQLTEPGADTMIRAMAHYITHADPNHFQPMNANFGIMHLNEKVKKKDRKAAYAAQAIAKTREEIANGRL